MLKSIKNSKELKKIETLRNELHQMVEDRGEWDQEVIKKSQELDRLMNKLHKKYETSTVEDKQMS